MKTPSRLPGRRVGLYLSKMTVERLERVLAKDKERGFRRDASALFSRALEIAEEQLAVDDPVRPCPDCRAAGAHRGEFLLTCTVCNNVHVDDDRKIVRVR